MIAGGALSVDTALGRAGSGTRVVLTHLIIIALVITLAFPTSTEAEGIPHKSRQAGTYGTVFAGFVVARLTLGVLTARVGLTQVVLIEGATSHERIAGHVSWTATDGRGTSHFTLGVNAALPYTRVHTLVAQTRRAVRGAVSMGQTLGPARCVGVTEVALRTGADSAMVAHFTLRSGGTGARTAGIRTLEVHTRLTGAAVIV